MKSTCRCSYRPCFLIDPPPSLIFSRINQGEAVWSSRLLVTMSPQEYPTPKNKAKCVEHLLVSPLNNGPESIAALIAKLKGQTMHVPDMLSCFPTCWPSGGRNKYYKRLKARFDEIIET